VSCATFARKKLKAGRRPELFLLQHPVRAATRGDEPYVGARIRRGNKMLELETPAVTSGKHYDAEVTEQLQLERRKLVSALVRPMSNYAAGFMRGGVVHLAPLSTTLQMRPDLSHVDDAPELLAEARPRSSKAT